MSRLPVAVLLVLVMTVLLTEMALAQALPSDAFTSGFQAEAEHWLTRLRPIARRLFTLLAAIELAVSGIVWGLKGGTLGETLGKFTLKVALLSFMFVVILRFDEWLPALMDSFIQAGAHAAGVPVLDPTGIAELGVVLSGELLGQAFDKGLLAVLTAEGLVAVWAGGLLVVAFALVAGQLILTLIESYIAVTAGVFFVGFAAFRGTASFTDRYLVWAISVGVRLFLLYLLVGAGSGIVSTWAEGIRALEEFDYTAALHMVGGAITFALVTWIIPNRVAHHLTDGASFGLAEAVRGD